MASSFGNYSILVSIVFMFILISPSFAEKHTSKLNKICPHTDDIDHPWCMKLMNSDSRTAHADTRGLIEVAIDLAYSKARDIFKDLDSHYVEWKGGAWNDRLTPCYKNYRDAMKDLEQAKKLFYNGDYKRIVVQVNHAIKQVRGFKSKFYSSANYASDLIVWNHEFRILCDVVKVLSKSF
ncbi:hypothetical protein ACSBR2_040561 [Camellia fascicularis]